MKENIVIKMEVKTVYSGKSVQSDSPIEYVERKGKGHPDTLIDGIVERASIDLSKAYIEKFGSILHHNLDKGLIIGGNSYATFGKSKIIRPIEIILAGRATRSYEGKDIPVDEIVKKAASDYLQENTRFLDIKNEVIMVLQTSIAFLCVRTLCLLQTTPLLELDLLHLLKLKNYLSKPKNI